MYVKEKLIACAMAGALALGLAACAAPAASQGSQGQQAASAASDASGAASQASASSAGATFTLGTVSANRYRNESFGFAWTAPEGWSFANESELAELNRSVASDAGDEEVADALAGGTAYLDMLATSRDGLSNVSVSVEGVSAQAMAATPQGKALDTVAAEATASLEGQGAANIKLEKATVAFCGAEAPCAVMTYELLDYPVFQRIVLSTRGSYLVTVTATSVNDDATAELLGLFQPA